MNTHALTTEQMSGGLRTMVRIRTFEEPCRRLAGLKEKPGFGVVVNEAKSRSISHGR